LEQSSTSAEGLAALSTAELQTLLQALSTGTLRGPIEAGGLAAANLIDLADRAGILLGLQVPAACAVVEAVLAERSDADEPPLDLVWTGPEHKGSTARDAAVVVRELFTKATSDLLIAGSAFDHGKVG
jgi:hypothetical protein